MASGGFEVTFEELQKAAAAYQEQADKIEAALKAYGKRSGLDRGDFGRVPGASQMWKQYQAFVKQVHGDVENLHNQINQGGAKLLLSAMVYQTADQTTAQKARGIGASGVGG